jgi:hypothetical protein
MRLLKLNDSGRLSLEWFPKDKLPSYAILSHTWGRGEDDEVTFKDIVDGTGDNKRCFQKLQFCGNQAIQPLCSLIPAALNNNFGRII